jgi:hypothetical protein
LIKKDAPKVIFVREHLGLQRQENPTGIHEIDGGETVLECNLLGSQMFFDRDREIGAAFDRRIVRGNHAWST